MYRRKDAYYAKAKASGYRSRAAFKLLQLCARAPLLRPGATVVDLGAWPGGWLQVAAEKVGPGGRVVGVDLQRIDPLGQPNVLLIRGSITDEATQEEVRRACPEGADTILSDVAPKLTGVRARDEAAVEALGAVIIDFSSKVLKPGGNLLLKTFAAADRAAQLRALRRMFAHVRETRPEATRKGSAEVYVIATGFRGDSQIPEK